MAATVMAMANPLSRAARRGRRLSRIRRDLGALRRELGVLEEQAVFQQQVEDDARTDAVVAGHDVAAREHRAAHSDLARTRRQQQEVRDRIAALEAEQDRLLEEMLG